MVAEKKLRELAEQKRFLLLQSDLHRKLITLECHNLATTAGWANRAGQTGRATSLLGFVLAPLVGVALACGWRKVFRWVGCGISAWRFVEPFLKR